jgi:hypothetical protein
MANTAPQGNVVWIRVPNQTGPEISFYGTDEVGDYWEKIVDEGDGITVYNRLAGAREVVGEWEPWRRTPAAANRRGSVNPRAPGNDGIGPAAMARTATAEMSPNQLANLRLESVGDGETVDLDLTDVESEE